MKKYDISIFGLEDREYQYEFSGEDAFFKSFNEEITGQFQANVVLKKTAMTLQLTISIDATVNLVCDRSLEPFSESFIINERYFFKFGEENNRDYSDDMEVIEYGTQIINIAQHLYDFIALAIPIKRIHPSLRTDQDIEEDFLVYTSGGDEEASEQKDEEIDPRWNALKKLK